MVYTKTLLLILINTFLCQLTSSSQLKKETYDLGSHTLVTDSNVFPYVAAILKKSAYLCAGALIDQSWVLTTADPLFLLKDSLKLLRVRLGSINYRKGGILLPMKYFEIHPYFDDKKPEYDLALVRLADSVRFTPNLSPIRIQKKIRELTATHFIVTAWPTPHSNSEETKQLESMESIKRKRILSVAHLHPSDPRNCSEELEGMNVTKHSIMCLEPSSASDPCERDAGAPVVLNGILWGIISSWKPDDCDLDVNSSFVTLVAASNTSSWIHATIQGKPWNERISWLDVIDYDEDDNDDDD